jgi:F0F1-type ATP synthase membrane subunit b/b'
MKTSFQNAVKDSQGEVTKVVHTSLQQSTKNINASVKEATKKIDYVVKKATEDTSKSIEKAQHDIDTTITSAQKNLSTDIAKTQENAKEAINTAVTNSTQSLVQTIESATEQSVISITDNVNRNIIQIPLRVGQKTPKRSLIGFLSDVYIEVGNVSSKHEFPIVVGGIKDSSGTLLKNVCLVINPTKKRLTKEPYSVTFSHKGRNFKIELYIEDAKNFLFLFKGQDFLTCQIIEL